MRQCDFSGSGSTVESDSLPRRHKLERIATLRDLLAEADARPKAATPRARQRRASLLCELAMALHATGDARAAIPVLEEMLAIARDTGYRGAESSALGNLAAGIIEAFAPEETETAAQQPVHVSPGQPG